MSTFHRFVSSLLVLFLLLAIGTNTVAAQHVAYRDGLQEDGTQNSVGVEELQVKGTQTVGTNQVLAYARYWFIPACGYYNGGATATIEVGYGLWTVDFYSSNTTYHGSGFCDSDICGYAVWAPQSGGLAQNEYIYYVTVNGTDPVIVSAWCGAMGSPEK